MIDVVKTFTDSHFFLSNFWEADVQLTIHDRPVMFSSSEAAYQALKHRAMDEDDLVGQWDYITRCSEADNPGFSKKVGRACPMNVSKWDSIKDNAMREVVFAKFLQNSDLCARLLETGSAMLVEGNTWGDVYWGRVDGRGLNRLGVILMEVRGFWLFNGLTDNLPYNLEDAATLDWS